MKNKFAVIAAILLLALFPRVARAQVPTVKITMVDAIQAGKITVDGSYTLPAKWTLVKIRIDARPTKATKGEGKSDFATIDAKKLTFTKTLTPVPTGTYDIQAVISANDPTGALRLFYSDTVADIGVK